MMQGLIVPILACQVIIALASPHPSRFPPRQQLLRANTSVLRPGWSGTPQCLADCVFDDAAFPLEATLLGPIFVNTTSMTIELCVELCDQQNMRKAGLLGTECHCSNILNPFTCFESDFGECEFDGEPCVGNTAESCGLAGGTPPLLNIFFKDLDVFPVLWSGGAKMTSGPWRLVYFYNDTVGARALPHNAVDLHPPLKRGNLTIEACVNTCGAAGFSLAGVEYADECYCGNELEHNSQPLPGQEPNSAAMPCKGDPNELCGGPNLLYVYTLPGSGLSPIVPFDSIFDGFGGDDSEFGVHT